ncbi:alpha/beta fold hydrolase [Candidatus Poriferisodalis sp.]|uniref:alpha/beta fold hydrolase n=1 Tax=Candidatus Poriferisodalis sp. TaxID=3101277 RepID=UPI003B02635E
MTAGNERLHAVVHDGDGPLAFLVHGALGSRSYWHDNLGALQTVCRPVVIELWGHGRSPSPADPERYRPHSYVAEFERLRVELDADRAWMIGQSLGAALALHYVLAQPAHVIGAVLTNSSSAFSEPVVWAERTETLVEERALEVEAHGIEVLRDSWINPGRSKRISPAVRAKLAGEFSEHDATGLVNTFRFTNAGVPLGDRLRNVAVPVLLTNGTEEGRFQHLLARARQIPELEIADLPASHAVNAQDPAGWNAAAIRFIRQHAGTQHVH